MSTDLRHRLGKQGERLAVEHLTRLGYEIVERNYRTRWGELDIVAYDGTALAFVEVKTRRLSRAGGPLETLRPPQRQRLRKMAGAWMIDRSDRPYSELIRFDAIGVTIDATGKLVSLEHLEGAF
jgi:putative endonuclease